MKLSYLISFAHRSPKQLHALLAKAKNEVMVDSGAFSVKFCKSVAKHVSLQGYDKFLSELPPQLKAKASFINFDVLRDGAGTMRNYKILKKHGVMPVYPFGTDFSHLDYYLDSAPVVCIGGLGTRTIKHKVSCFEAIKKRYSLKIFRRLHLLSVGRYAEQVLNKYQPLSTDSAILNHRALYRGKVLMFKNDRIADVNVNPRVHKVAQNISLNFPHYRLIKDLLHPSHYREHIVSATIASMSAIHDYQTYYLKKNPPTKIHLVIGPLRIIEALLYTEFRPRR